MMPKRQREKVPSTLSYSSRPSRRTLSVCLLPPSLCSVNQYLRFSFRCETVTSGCGAIYFQNVLNALPDSDLVKNYHKKGIFNPEGSKLIAGQRLLPGKVTRAIDANHVRIQQEVKMNGAFRYVSFSSPSLVNDEQR